jgi:SAM-dependent methyltransferase
MYDARAALRGGRAHAPDAAREEAALRQMRRLRRLVGGRGRPGLLDYGAGAGLWTRAAIAAGFDAVGFEPSAARSGGEVPAIDALDDPPRRAWDAINLEQVLEHIPDPAAALAALHGRCKPGALLRISVPDIGRAARRAEFWRDFPFGGHAHLMSPYEHLHGFTGISLRRLLHRAGFRECGLGRVAAAFPAYAGRRIAGLAGASCLPTFFIGTADEGHGH